jgi:ethanolamine utilization protein EutQ
MEEEGPLLIEIHRADDVEMVEVPVADGAQVLVSQVVGGDGMPDRLGVGHARYVGAWDYKLNYAAAYLMLEGSLRLTSEGHTHQAHVGDVVYLERGTTLRYDAGDGCMIFWVAYPGNWEEITDLPGRRRQ